MEDIRSVLTLASKRLGLVAFLEKLHWVAIGTAGIALVLMVAWKLLDEVRTSVAWTWAGPALAGVTLIAALGWWMQQRRSALHVAMEVDDRLDLREKMSTALLCRGRNDAFARAAVEDAITVARNPGTRERVRRMFAVQAPRNWWVSPMIAVTAGLLGFLVPNTDVWGKEIPKATETDRVAIEQAKSETEKAIAEAAKALKKDPEEVRKMLEGDPKTPVDPNAERSVEETKREAFKKMTQLAEQVKSEAEQKAAALDALTQKMAKMAENAGEGPAADLNNALSKGDFKSAKEELSKLEAKLANKELKPEEKAALQNQMSQMAQNLQQMSQMNDALAQALQNAGMDQQLANNPQALQQAIQNNQNLTQDQKQALGQMAQAMAQANQMAQQMAGAMQNAANQMGQNGQQGQGQQGMQQMAGQLSQMEMMQAELGQMQAAMQGLAGQCQGMGQGLGQNPGQGQGISTAQAQQLWQQMNSLSNSQGPGMGQRGQGRGGQAQRIATQTNLKGDKMQATGDGDAPIIGSRYIQLDGQIKGESKAQFQQLLNDLGISRAQDETNEDLIPVQYQPAVREFYGEVEDRAKEQEPAKTDEKKDK